MFIATNGIYFIYELYVMVLIKCMSQNYLILTVHGHNYAQLYVQIIFIVHVFLAYFSAPFAIYC